MGTSEKTARLEVGSKLSTLWVLVLFNMVFADVIGFMNPGALEKIIAGATGFEITQTLLLIFAVLLQIPIAMVFLSRVMSRRANRLVNTVAVALTTPFIIFGGSTYLTYLFFATMEVIFMLLILWFAWTWPNNET